MAKVSYGRRVGELADRDPEAVAFVCGEQELRRGELEARTNRRARTYAERGVGAGDLVTLALPNGLELVEACIATWKLGAVPNPISPRMPLAERARIVERAQPALVIDSEEEPTPSLPDGPLPDRTPPHERALASGGSTGTPKLILPANPGSYDPEAPSPLFTARHAALVPGPLSHAVPFSAAFQGVFGGATAVLLPRFDAAETLAAVERHRVDRMHVVPTMMLRIWRLPEAERLSRDVSSLDFVMTGSAPCPAWLMRAWIDWLGPDVLCEAFGPSERIGGTFITGREWLAHPGSVGKPSAASQLRILDPETGAPLPTGELGEIYMLPATGPGSTYRYVGSEARRTPDGWESVGDMGWLDADGYLYLGDRRTDMILTGGRNVYPAEVEAALTEHPDVRSCCVIGLPDEDLGNRVHALVELSAPISDDALRDHLRALLVAWKLPRTFERVDGALRDDAGKARRAALRSARLPGGGEA
ncbi:MAG: AMP-binding protein [Myxococcota bacterium]|nr:AMP-binding protein [Myxococcota bacterium]